MRKGSEKLWQVENNLYVGERYLGEVEGKILYIPYGFYISDKTIAKLLKKYELRIDTSGWYKDANSTIALIVRQLMYEVAVDLQEFTSEFKLAG